MTTTTINSNGHVSLKGLESLAALLPATEPLASTEVEAKPEPKATKVRESKAKVKTATATPTDATDAFETCIDVLSHSGSTAVFYSKDISKNGKFVRTDTYAMIGNGVEWILTQLNPETGLSLKSGEVAQMAFSKFDGIEFISMKRDPEFLSEIFNGFLANLQHPSPRKVKIADRLFAVSLVAMTLIRGSVSSDNIRVNGKQLPIAPAQWQAILDKTCDMFQWFATDDRVNAIKFLKSMKAL